MQSGRDVELQPEAANKREQQEEKGKLAHWVS